MVFVLLDPNGSDVFEDGTRLRVTGDWTPGKTLADMKVDGKKLVAKIGKISGFRA